jgi:hypothetical protein
LIEKTMEQSKILDKLDEFNVQVQQAFYNSDLRKRIYGLHAIAYDVIKYLQSEVKDLKMDSKNISMNIGEIKYLLNNNPKSAFSKNQSEEIKVLNDRCDTIKAELLKRISILRDYVTENKIVSQ